jgi:hypothetical protein
MQNIRTYILIIHRDHVYIHTYTPKYMYPTTSTYFNSYTYTCTCTYIHTYRSTCIMEYILQEYIHTYIQIHHAYICTYVHTYIYVYKHTSLLIPYFSFPWTFPSHRFYVLINYQNQHTTVHTYVYTYVHSYRLYRQYIHTYIHTYIHIPKLNSWTPTLN